jgi:osmotically-inducible protein OsmY
MTPTSDRTGERLYAVPDATVSATPVPRGATSQDWQLAEEIRALLSSDEKLGNAPMAAVVNNGVVTLRGGVRNEKDRRKLIEQISALPGVQRVDDQMELKNPLGIGPGETKSY